VIFVCENNGFAEFTSRAEHSPVERVSDVVAPYGFPRETVDGSDVAAVWSAFGSFLSQARAGSGPFLLECLTHRRRGHYEGDAQEYRDEGAEREWELRDPLPRFQALALQRRWVARRAAEEIASDARAAVEQAVEFAKASPFPTAALAADLVYA
jgi:pyruvate dehydrogenase E1 component alpha subunit